MISSGRLRHRIRLEEEVTLGQDSQTGGLITRWDVVSTHWAAIEPLSAREFIAAQSAQSEVASKIILRKPARIDAAMRVVHLVNGTPTTRYDIKGILADKDSGLEYVTLPVSSDVRYAQDESLSLFVFVDDELVTVEGDPVEV